jgi:rubrerythrin
MAETERCPICQQADVHLVEGRLDQSGHTFLPTAVWTCDLCGYARYEPALGVRWQSAQAVAKPSPVVELPRRRAA